MVIGFIKDKTANYKELTPTPLDIKNRMRKKPTTDKSKSRSHVIFSVINLNLSYTV